MMDDGCFENWSEFFINFPQTTPALISTNYNMNEIRSELFVIKWMDANVSTLQFKQMKPID